MLKKSRFMAAAIATVFLIGFGPLAHASGCDAVDKIDGSTADAAKKKIEVAGFHQVSGLKKGCDNFWHGTANKDGSAVHVVLSPQGEVMVEGN